MVKYIILILSMSLLYCTRKWDIVKSNPVIVSSANGNFLVVYEDQNTIVKENPNDLKKGKIKFYKKINLNDAKIDFYYRKNDNYYLRKSFPFLKSNGHRNRMLVSGNGNFIVVLAHDFDNNFFFCINTSNNSQIKLPFSKISPFNWEDLPKSAHGIIWEKELKLDNDSTLAISFINYKNRYKDSTVLLRLDKLKYDPCCPTFSPDRY